MYGVVDIYVVVVVVAFVDDDWVGTGCHDLTWVVLLSGTNVKYTTFVADCYNLPQ